MRPHYAACFPVASGYKLIHDLLNQEAGRVKRQEIKGGRIRARQTQSYRLKVIL